MAKSKPTGVFVMEGKWETEWATFRPARRSATQLLNLLEHEGRIRTQRNDTLRQAQLRRSFMAWARTRAFPIGYVASHGDRGIVEPGSAFARSASLAEIASWIGPGGADGRVLVLGTCLTLGAPRQARDLAQETGLLSVLGYRRQVDTISAAAFEVLLLDEVASLYARAPDHKLTAVRLEAGIARFRTRHQQLARDLGFEAAMSDSSSSR